MLLPGSTEFEGLIGGDNFLNHTVETLKDSPSASLIAFGPRQLNWTSLNGEAYLQFRFCWDVISHVDLASKYKIRICAALVGGEALHAASQVSRVRVMRQCYSAGGTGWGG
jgi:hypothetical protein